MNSPTRRSSRRRWRTQPDFLKLFAANKKEVAVAKQVTGLEESWNRKARENYTKAAELAQQATAAIK